MELEYLQNQLIGFREQWKSQFGILMSIEGAIEFCEHLIKKIEEGGENPPSREEKDDV